MSRPVPSASVVAIPLRSGQLAVPVQEGVADLRRARVVHGDVRAVLSTEEGNGRPIEPPAEIDAPPLIELIRTALGEGHRVLFPARGASMRLSIPDGSVLEVARAEPGTIRPGDVLLVAPEDRRLIAHRVSKATGTGWTLEADTASRRDEILHTDLLGRVVARIDPVSGVRRPVDGAFSRWKGRLVGFLYRPLRAAARVIVVLPLRSSPHLRAACGFFLRLVSAALRKLETLAFVLRRPVDRVRAGLLGTEEKDRERSRLYAKKAVRDFTALDENIEAGLTLIEEVMFQRHPLPDGAALVVGCGPGRECVALAKTGREVHGLDRDQAMLGLAGELAARHGVRVDYVRAEAVGFDLGKKDFGSCLILSGLYNMVLPSKNRVRMLRSAAAHLRPGGLVYLTFLSDYVPAGSPVPHDQKPFLAAIQPDHERGDIWLLNEAIHVHRHPDFLVREAEEAGLQVVALFRDQRAYDRLRGHVRGFAVLRPKTGD